jgi:hypothetical protein
VLRLYDVQIFVFQYFQHEGCEDMFLLEHHNSPSRGYSKAFIIYGLVFSISFLPGNVLGGFESKVLMQAYKS